MTVSGETGELVDRVVVVTGSGRPPGRTAALAVATAGARVCCVDADAAELELTVKAVAAAGGQAQGIHREIRSRADADKVVSEVLDREKRLDVLCNFKQESGDGQAIEDLTSVQFDQLFRANFKSTLFASQAAGSVMVEAGGGSIINLCSGIIDIPLRRTGSCAISAAAVALLAKVMAKEVGTRNVRVNTIVASPSLGLPIFSEDDPLELPAFPATAQVVLDRQGTVADLGPMTVFLASDSSAFITGQTIRLSGGWAMPW